MLFHVDKRFQQDQIYTRVDRVLVCVNPFVRLPLYGKEIVDSFIKQEPIMEAHSFTIADNAYRLLITSNSQQSIVISGESGAGKTESTKHCLKYLSDCAGSETSVDKKILQSNPILEAFGNAKTKRNSNSSRFGKYIEVFFDKKHMILGAKNTSYLLEKIRVTSQQKNERNYHVFYQILSGASREVLKTLELDNISEQNCGYLNKSGCYKIEGIDDPYEFKEMVSALSDLGLPSEAMFKIVAGCLHLGNIDFRDIGDRECEIITPTGSYDAAESAARLLGLNSSELKESLVKLAFVSARKGSARQKIGVNSETASFMRDGLARFVYSKLFDWIVMKINDAIKVKEVEIPTNASGSALSIGILDIFGFESFEINSFEQLCINYTNEVLQLVFTTVTLVRQLAIYEEEGIDYSSVNFTDNSAQVELISHRKTGLFAIIEETIKLPRTSDELMMENFLEIHSNSSCFQQVLKHKDHFTIKHYAGDVEYDSNGFLVKSRDVLSNDIHDILYFNCNSGFVKELLEENDNSSVSRKKTSLGVQFRNQVQALSENLEKTSSHYIRCIKPNDVFKPRIFNERMVKEQLMNSGIFSLLKIRKQGFTFQMSHYEWFDTYRVICPGVRAKKNDKDLNKKIDRLLKEMNLGTPEVQLGKTRIFYRAKQHRRMAKLRHEKITCASTQIQRRYRGQYVRQFINKWRNTILPEVIKCWEAKDVAAMEKALLSSQNVNLRPTLRVLELVDLVMMRSNLIALKDSNEKLAILEDMWVVGNVKQFQEGLMLAEELGNILSESYAVSKEKYDVYQDWFDNFDHYLDLAIESHNIEQMEEFLQFAKDIDRLDDAQEVKNACEEIKSWVKVAAAITRPIDISKAEKVLARGVMAGLNPSNNKMFAQLESDCNATKAIKDTLKEAVARKNDAMIRDALDQAHAIGYTDGVAKAEKLLAKLENWRDRAEEAINTGMNAALDKLDKERKSLGVTGDLADQIEELASTATGWEDAMVNAISQKNLKLLEKAVSDGQSLKMHDHPKYIQGKQCFEEIAKWTLDAEWALSQLEHDNLKDLVAQGRNIVLESNELLNRLITRDSDINSLNKRIEAAILSKKDQMLEMLLIEGNEYNVDVSKLEHLLKQIRDWEASGKAAIANNDYEAVAERKEVGVRMGLDIGGNGVMKAMDTFKAKVEAVDIEFSNLLVDGSSEDLESVLSKAKSFNYQSGKFVEAQKRVDEIHVWNDEVKAALLQKDVAALKELAEKGPSIGIKPENNAMAREIEDSNRTLDSIDKDLVDALRVKDYPLLERIVRKADEHNYNEGAYDKAVAVLADIHDWVERTENALRECDNAKLKDLTAQAKELYLNSSNHSMVGKLGERISALAKCDTDLETAMKTLQVENIEDAIASADSLKMDFGTYKAASALLYDLKDVAEKVKLALHTKNHEDIESLRRVGATMGLHPENSGSMKDIGFFQEESNVAEEHLKCALDKKTEVALVEAMERANELNYKAGSYDKAHKLLAEIQEWGNHVEEALGERNHSRVSVLMKEGVQLGLNRENNPMVEMILESKDSNQKCDMRLLEAMGTMQIASIQKALLEAEALNYKKGSAPRAKKLIEDITKWTADVEQALNSKDHSRAIVLENEGLQLGLTKNNSETMLKISLSMENLGVCARELAAAIQSRQPSELETAIEHAKELKYTDEFFERATDILFSIRTWEDSVSNMLDAKNYDLLAALLNEGKTLGLYEGNSQFVVQMHIISKERRGCEMLLSTAVLEKDSVNLQRAIDEAHRLNYFTGSYPKASEMLDAITKWRLAAEVALKNNEHNTKNLQKLFNLAFDLGLTTLNTPLMQGLEDFQQDMENLEDQMTTALNDMDLKSLKECASLAEFMHFTEDMYDQVVSSIKIITEWNNRALEVLAAKDIVGLKVTFEESEKLGLSPNTNDTVRELLEFKDKLEACDRNLAWAMDALSLEEMGAAMEEAERLNYLSDVYICVKEKRHALDEWTVSTRLALKTNDNDVLPEYTTRGIEIGLTEGNSDLFRSIIIAQEALEGCGHSLQRAIKSRNLDTLKTAITKAESLNFRSSPFDEAQLLVVNIESFQNRAKEALSSQDSTGIRELITEGKDIGLMPANNAVLDQLEQYMKPLLDLEKSLIRATKANNAKQLEHAIAQAKKINYQVEAYYTAVKRLEFIQRWQESVFKTIDEFRYEKLSGLLEQAEAEQFDLREDVAAEKIMEVRKVLVESDRVLTDAMGSKSLAMIQQAVDYAMRVHNLSDALESAQSMIEQIISWSDTARTVIREKDNLRIAELLRVAEELELNPEENEAIYELRAAAKHGFYNPAQLMKLLSEPPPQKPKAHYYPPPKRGEKYGRQPKRFRVSSPKTEKRKIMDNNATKVKAVLNDKAVMEETPSEKGLRFQFTRVTAALQRLTSDEVANAEKFLKKACELMPRNNELGILTNRFAEQVNEAAVVDMDANGNIPNAVRELDNFLEWVRIETRNSLRERLYVAKDILDAISHLRQELKTIIPQHNIPVEEYNYHSLVKTLILP